MREIILQSPADARDKGPYFKEFFDELELPDWNPMIYRTFVNVDAHSKFVFVTTSVEIYHSLEAKSENAQRELAKLLINDFIVSGDSHLVLFNDLERRAPVYVTFFPTKDETLTLAFSRAH